MSAPSEEQVKDTPLAIARDQLAKCRNFIRALAKRSENYGSDFSADIHHDCTNFLRDCKAPVESTAVVMTKGRYQSMLSVQAGLARKCSAAQAENKALREALETTAVRAFTIGHHHGHHATVEGTFFSVVPGEEATVFLEDVRGMIGDGSLPEAQAAITAKREEVGRE